MHHGKSRGGFLPLKEERGKRGKGREGARGGRDLALMS